MAYRGFVALPLWEWHATLRRRFGHLGGQSRALVVALCWSAAIAVPIALRLFTVSALSKSPLDYHRERMGVLLLVSLVVAFPAVLNFQLVQHAADALSFTDSATSEASRISNYLFLQNQLRGLLAILGGLVTVGVIEQGALLNALNALPDENAPGELIFVFASLLAAGLAVLYLPTFSALQRAGHSFLIFSLHCRASAMTPSSPPARSATVSNRCSGSMPAPRRTWRAAFSS
ncbi:MAG: hypothetical protein M3N45_04770 [Actinomycetota bacterium]|nr:hypothetical protein [Actinomycetota bacterium]